MHFSWLKLPWFGRQPKRQTNKHVYVITAQFKDWWQTYYETPN